MKDLDEPVHGQDTWFKQTPVAPIGRGAADREERVERRE
jgi:hypothetical protein